MTQKKTLGERLSQRINRRTVLKSGLSIGSGALGFLTGAIAHDIGANHLDKVHQELSESLTTPAERHELTIDLFFPKSGGIDVVPARDHPTLPKLSDRELTYPNELHAMKAIRSMFGSAREIVTTAYPANERNSLISVGSSAANILTRKILGSPQAPSTVYETLQFSAGLHYSIKEIEHSEVTRLQDGREHRVPNRAIVNSDGKVVAVPESRSHTLTNDLLLVTRIPRSLDGTEIVIFAGTHGPAVRAIEQLLFHASPHDLFYLKRLLEEHGSNSFQAIFQIERLIEEDDTTKPGAIHLVTYETAKPRAVGIQLT